MNNDLISREALKKALKEKFDDFIPEGVYDEIDNAPTIELTELCKGCQYLKDCETCEECAREHKQLAEWLKELKDYREGTRTCENCKHEHKSETEYPCSICRCNHVNKFEWKGGAE